MKRVAIVVNKSEPRLRPSETFLLAHIRQLPAATFALVGNPGYRRHFRPNDQRTDVTSRLIQFGLTLERRLNWASSGEQDYRMLRRFLRRNAIDAVLAEYGPSAVSVMKACADGGIPLISHFHGYDAYRLDVLQSFGKAYRELFDISAALVAVSEHMRAQLISLGACPSKVTTNPCGAELPPNMVADPANAGPRFVMVGRLVPKKAPLISLRAFARVAELNADASLDVIGDGPLSQECKDFCSASGLGGQVHFHGAAPHAQVFETMLQARCFIQHSVTAEDGDREGTPVGVIEAMGIGLPVVATRHGGIPDVIDDGVTGSLVDERDEERMFEFMRLYLENPMLASQVGKRARAAVLANWTSAKSIARLWAIISAAMSNGAS